MEITKTTRTQLRFQGIIFVILFFSIIAMLAWISSRYNYEADLTANNRNTLSAASITLIQAIPEPIKISAFIPEGNLLSNRLQIQELVKKYQKYNNKITLEFINPDTHPDIVRQMKISAYGEVVVEYLGRNENLIQFKEQNLTNALQRLLRQGERRILFISGHGERNPSGRANFDWQDFTTKLKTKGISSTQIKLNETPEIPLAAALVIASPLVEYLPGEVKLVLDYVKSGGNLIWIHEPGKNLFGLEPLAELFGISFYPGTIVDPTTQMLNVADPSFSLLTSYPRHAITRGFEYMSIFPRAVAINHENIKSDWLSSVFLQTVARSWSEQNPLKGVIDYNKGKDILGPLTIGLTLSRELKNKNDKPKKQRIVILGDGDFLSNAYLGNQGNQNIGHNIINWISNDDAFIDIPGSNSPDTLINISEMMGAIIALVFLIILPLGLIGSGIIIWYKRRSY